jgi:WD40 repeat protein
MLLLTNRHLGGPIHGLDFSPDGSLLASAGLNGKILLHDLAGGTGKLLSRQERPFQVAFSPDGAALAVADDFGVLHWPLSGESGRHLTQQGDSAAFQVRYSPDGRWLAANPGGLCLWAAPALESDFFSRPADWTQSLAFSPEGRTLAIGCHNRGHRLSHFITVVEIPSRQELHSFKGLNSYVSSLNFSPDGRTLAAACGSVVRVWSMPEGRELLAASHGRHYIHAVAFTPDGKFLATGHGDGLVRFWQTTDWTPSSSFDWGIGPVNSLAIAADGMRAAAGSSKGKVVVWDVDL